MVYAFIANGTEETEIITPVDILRRCGVEVKTVGVGGRTVTTSHNITVTCDITEDEMILNDELELIILPGGMPGTNNLENSRKVQTAIDFCDENGKFIAAICAAPSILGHKGLLEGRKAVCYRGFEQELKGAQVLNVPAVADGKIITARGAGAAVEFGLKIVEAMISPEKAAEAADRIMYGKNGL